MYYRVHTMCHLSDKYAWCLTQPSVSFETTMPSIYTPTICIIKKELFSNFSPLNARVKISATINEWSPIFRTELVRLVP